MVIGSLAPRLLDFRNRSGLDDDMYDSQRGFLIVFVPLGVLQRLFGVGPIELAIQKERATYWQAKREQPTHSDYERQF